MSDYQDITGTRIKYLSSDPTLESSYEGQIWYNSTTGVNKTLIKFGAFVSGGNLNTSRYELGGAGTKTAGIVAGGYLGPPGNTGDAEEYNGFSWAEQNNLNTTRRTLTGFGTQTASAFCGGYTSTTVANTELYNGSSFSETGDLNTGRYGHTGNGTQTAGLVYGGSGGDQATEEFDGSSWTSSNNTNVAGRRGVGGGTQTAAIYINRESPPGASLKSHEQYDGTSWTTQADTNIAREYCSGSGSQDSCLTAGGSPNVATSELWDGTSFASSASMGTGRGAAGMAGGTTVEGFIAGGDGSPAHTNATEEFNFSINTITKAAWASGGNLGTARYKVSGANQGTQDAALAFGGRESGSPPSGPGNVTNKTEEYNGTSWSEQNNLNTETRGAAGAGTQTAGVRMGGFDGGPSEQNNFEFYDGTSWTAQPTIPDTIRLGGGGGTQTAAIVFGGLSSTTETYEYDGSSWTSGGDLNTEHYNLAGLGTQTAALAAGDAPASNAVEEYNGSAWTTVTAMPENKEASMGSGAQTAGMVFGGQTPPYTGSTLLYDGTNWTATAPLSTARESGATGSGTSNTAGLCAGGNAAPSITNATEEFTGGTETITSRTLTTS